MTDSRRYPRRPVLGVGELIFSDDCILLLERGREPLKGQWSLPGGALETGETLEAGVCREVAEETGLRVKPTGILEVFERIMPDAQGRAEYHYVLIDYFCRVEGGALCPGDDCARAEWVRREDLGQYAITEGTLEVIEKGFQRR